MPVTYYDDQGNPVVLDVESVDEIATLKASAALAEDLKGKVEKYEGDENYKGLRTAREKAEGEATRLKALLAKNNIEAGNTDVLTAERVAEIAEGRINSTKEKEVDEERESLLDQMSGGDDNKRKALASKFSELVGDKKFTDRASMLSKLNDAAYLVNKTRDSAEPSMLDKINSPALGGGPKRKEQIKNRGTAVNALQAFGYQFKGKKEDYL